MTTTQTTTTHPAAVADELRRRITAADPTACFGHDGTYAVLIDSCDCGCNDLGVRVKARKGGRLTFAQVVAMGYALELGKTGGHTANGAYITL